MKKILVLICLCGFILPQVACNNSGSICNKKETYIGKWKKVGRNGIMTIEDNGTNLLIKDDNGQKFTAEIKEDCTLQTSMIVSISYVKATGHLVWVNGEYEKMGTANNETGQNTKEVTNNSSTTINTSATIKIGNQEWTSENLNVSTFKNGDAIPEAKTEEAWETAGEEGKPAWCYYDNDATNGDKYGKLYNWYAATDPRGLAPSGWHIPSDAEWTKLTDYLSGTEAVGNKMKSKDGWEDNGNSSNESGFSGLPGGIRTYNGTFKFIGKFGYWWSSTEFSTSKAWFHSLFYASGNVIRDGYSNISGFSVRCIRD